MAWSFCELVKPAGPGLALLALLFRVAEAAMYGVVAMFILLLLGPAGAGLSGLGAAAPASARSVLFTLGSVATIYFCGGSAIFFHLFLKGRFIPRAIAALGLIAMIASLAAALVQIGGPAFARYWTFSGPLLLAAELLTGGWLLVFGVGRRHRPLSDPPSVAA
jgi:hypothetical protein